MTSSDPGPDRSASAVICPAEAHSAPADLWAVAFRCRGNRNDNGCLLSEALRRRQAAVTTMVAYPVKGSGYGKLRQAAVSRGHGTFPACSQSAALPAAPPSLPAGHQHSISVRLAATPPLALAPLEALARPLSARCAGCPTQRGINASATSSRRELLCRCQRDRKPEYPMGGVDQRRAAACGHSACTAAECGTLERCMFYSFGAGASKLKQTQIGDRRTVAPLSTTRTSKRFISKLAVSPPRALRAPAVLLPGGGYVEAAVGPAHPPFQRACTFLFAHVHAKRPPHVYALSAPRMFVHLTIQ